jgi:hypothetical protein
MKGSKECEIAMIHSLSETAISSTSLIDALGSTLRALQLSASLYAVYYVMRNVRIYTSHVLLRVAITLDAGWAEVNVEWERQEYRIFVGLSGK